jgi:alkanesulfonate monooxygenase SsuD/methylene tetrahydromethanopterin reductase-like flavin-dependent oxidoreductase (luciferase family)
MPVDFGLALVEKHPKSHLTKWMDDLDAVLPILEGHFRSLWMTDHLFWGEQYAYEAWTVLSFLAAKWPRFDVGPMVLGQNYRNPALLAKMGATLQIFSHGRFIMGIGAGWKEDEYVGYGYDFPPVAVRMEQLDDTLEIIKRLWMQPGKVTYQGKHYHIVDAILEPKPDPVPPIVIGGGGKKTMLLAARHADWWNISDSNLEKYTDRLGVLKQHCADIGRDINTLRLTWFGRLSVGKTREAALARAAKYGWTPDRAFIGTAQEIVDQLKSFVDIGVDYFMLDILDLPDIEVQRSVLEDIVPKVKG